MSEPASLKPEIALPDALSPEYLLNYRVLPLALTEGKLRVAAVGDPDPQALDDLSMLFRAPIELVPADEERLLAAIRRVMDDSASVMELVTTTTGEPTPAEGQSDALPADARDLANQPPVIRYVNLLIRDAHTEGASDIHLESSPAGLRVRFRIDGVLTDVEGPPRAMTQAVVSRIKLLAEVDIAERRAPQDGRVRARLEDRALDLRVSTMPSLAGESVVLRLLDRGGRPVLLDELGMDAATHDAIRLLALKPHGIVLATGPTGSGKTTTLYSALALRDAMSEKILTVEDPVEYLLAGVTQVPVNVKAGITFATALRSALRQDPDVMMVGEMRDEETADIAIRAALTGHLVFSTLHTNDAVSAIPRLIDLKVADYLIASTLEGILAQRLVRRICDKCPMTYAPDPQVLSLLAERPVGSMRFVRGAGCPVCRHTGYRGRTGLFELLVFDDDLKDLIIQHPGRAELRDLARAKGMRTLRQDGWAKAQAGITTVEEVLRVVER